MITDFCVSEVHWIAMQFHFITIGFRSLFAFSIFDLCINLAFINVLPLQVIAKQFSCFRIDSWLHYILQQINCTKIPREFGEVECWMGRNKICLFWKIKPNGKFINSLKRYRFLFRAIRTWYKIEIIYYFQSVRKI